MRRTNMHLSEESIKELDNILTKLNSGEYWNRITRADLIRYSIFKTFAVETGYHGHIENRLEKLSTKANKKSKK